MSAPARVSFCIDVTVETAYTPSGQIATLTAKNPTTGDQVTTYIYGTTKTSIAPVVYRNDLLTAEIYPDSDDYLDIAGILQNGTDNIADRVAYQYNRLGERIWKRDQNGTVHTYEFDNLGRILEDRVTTLATGVDNAVLRISTDYTPTGQVDALASVPPVTSEGQMNTRCEGVIQWKDNRDKEPEPSPISPAARSECEDVIDQLAKDYPSNVGKLMSMFRGSGQCKTKVVCECCKRGLGGSYN